MVVQLFISPSLDLVLNIFSSFLVFQWGLGVISDALVPFVSRGIEWARGPDASGTGAHSGNQWPSWLLYQPLMHPHPHPL